MLPIAEQNKREREREEEVHYVFVGSKLFFRITLKIYSALVVVVNLRAF